MKTSLISIVFLLGLQYISAQGIQFSKGTWADILAKAKAENKNIFVDAYAPSCGFCKWMEDKVFIKDSVGEVYNKNFICYKFDMEIGEGRNFAQKYNVNAFPTYLFFDANGELIHASRGAKKAEYFIKDAEDALNPDKQLASLKKQYENGKRDTAFLSNYLIALWGGGMIDYASQPLHDYLSKQNEENLKKRWTFSFISSLTNDVNHTAFRVLTQYANDYKKLLKDTIFSRTIYSMMYRCYENAGKKADFAMKLQIDTAVTKLPILKKTQEELTLNGILWYAEAKKDMDMYCLEVEKLIKNYPKKFVTPDDLNNYAWTIYENTDDKLKLKKAEKYAKSAVKRQKDYPNMDTYAHVLFKLGKFKQAKKAIEIAIELGKKEQDDVSESMDLLEKIKKQIN